ncbi:MAG TPA: NADH-quinone oxidoreductase subunit J [Opitutaceae bacterium]|jgi:NADH:ubiquinone oxidoreductase subunit 6 (subunit J)|nr:NADH-quinone oxidoreductase subunit J [Opitutaceae bacterium]
MINFAFALIAFLLLASAATAMALRNIIHSALLLVVSWFALALFYLWAGAEFAAFAQVLIYAGAISMVVLFAVLLTQRTLGDFTLAPESRRRALAAVLAGAAVAAAMAYAVLNSPLAVASTPVPTVTVRELGEQLMGPQAAALLVVGAILTVALVGAVVIAAQPGKSEQKDAR